MSLEDLTVSALPSVTADTSRNLDGAIESKGDEVVEIEFEEIHRKLEDQNGDSYGAEYEYYYPVDDEVVKKEDVLTQERVCRMWMVFQNAARNAGYDTPFGNFDCTGYAPFPDASVSGMGKIYAYPE